MRNGALLLAFCAALALATPALAKSQNYININQPKSDEQPQPTKRRVAQRPSVLFAKVIDDLPLMPGLTLVGEKDMLFQSPNGRIAETTAKGKVDIDSVYDFYTKTLPQLGWKVVDARTYLREREVLRLDVSGSGKNTVTTVRFSVQPDR